MAIKVSVLVIDLAGPAMTAQLAVLRYGACS
jgi:hypothetical protein